MDKTRVNVFLKTGLTLLEMVVAMSLFTVLLAVLLPQFRILQRSWGLKEASAESVQYARVLFDHVQRSLAAASSVTAVSGPAEPFGFLEFEDADHQL